MAHICHVISGYFRNDARVFLRQCLSLVRAGHDVSILTNDGEPDEVVDGVQIYACDTQWPRWRVLMGATRQFLSLALKVDADVYQIHSPELLPLGLRLKRLGKSVVYDAHEDLPRHILEKEWLPNLFRQPISVATEVYLRRTLRQFDEVVSPHSHVVADLQQAIGKGILVANFPLIDESRAFSLAEYRARSKIVCYSGTVYSYSNQEEIIDALKTVPEARYDVAGYIPEDHRQALMSREGAARVRFLGRLSRSDLRQFYLSSRVGVVVYDYKLNLGGRLGSYGTNKIFEYMEAGLPIICTDYDLWKDIVARYGCGICVEPGNSMQIAEACQFLLANPEKAFSMGQAGRKAVLEEFNWDTENRKYINMFTRILQASGPIRRIGTQPFSDT